MPRVADNDGTTPGSRIHPPVGSSVGAMSVWTRWLVAATGAVFVIGIVVATATPGPLLTVDDIAYLAMGRTVAGEGAAPMPPQSPYGVLYPLLLAPGWLVGLEGDGMIGYARTLNAAAGALTVPALYAFLRRLPVGIDERRAVVAATVGSLLPAALLTSSIVWTERLLALLVVVALVALARALESTTVRSALTAIGAAAALYAAHPRLGPAAVVVIGVAAAAIRRPTWRPNAAAAALGATGLVAVEWVRRAVASATFDDSGTYDALDLASRRGVDEIVPMLQHGLGALTYLVLAATGIAAWGIVVLARTGRTGWPTLAVGAVVLAIAAWFLTGVPRADKWLHGRYIEVLAPVLVAVGLALLHRLRWRLGAGLLIGLPMLAGVVAAWNGPGDTWASARSPVMMLGVEVAGAPYGADVFEPGAAASVAVVVGVVAWGLSRWRVEAAGGLLAVACVWGAHSGLETLDQLHEFTAAGEIDERLDADLDVGGLQVDIATVSANLTNALAWEVGFDRTTIELTPETTHVLMRPGATPPVGASLVAEFSLGTLWALDS